MKYGRIFLVFSIANLTYPRTFLQTSYSLIISNDNQTISSSYIRGFGLKVTALSVQDNYDGSTNRWRGGNLTDAAQVATLFYFRTSALHELRFTVSYGLYDLFPLGYLSDNSATQSFNVTQSVL